jgi:hypothetical protein
MQAEDAVGLGIGQDLDHALCLTQAQCTTVGSETEAPFLYSMPQP